MISLTENFLLPVFLDTMYQESMADRKKHWGSGLPLEKNISMSHQHVWPHAHYRFTQALMNRLTGGIQCSAFWEMVYCHEISTQPSELESETCLDFLFHSLYYSNFFLNFYCFDRVLYYILNDLNIWRWQQIKFFEFLFYILKIWFFYLK